MKKTLLLSLALFSCSFSSIYAQNNNKIISIERNPIDNTPGNIIFSAESKLAIENSKDILKEYLGLTNPDINLVQVKSTNPYTGITVLRFDEFYKGVKVAHGAYTVSAKNNLISSIHGNIYKPENSLPATTTLSEGDALQKALAHTNAQTYMWQDADAESLLRKITKKADATYFPVANKVWVEDFTLDKSDKQLHLAYCFDVYAKEPMSRKLVYVDANTGKILLEDAIIKHVTATGKSVYSGNVSFETATATGGYILEDLTRGGGVFTGSYTNTTATTSDVTNTTTSWPMSIAIDAHWGAEKVYDYWKLTHGRKSYDDFDSPLTSYVNYGVNYNNAFWNGSFMTYGDGSGALNGGFDPLASLDVTGHEIGHGVCGNTAGLVYQRESGAINEGLSDIWGETIEHYASPNKPMWQVGAEIARNPLRSMSNPKLYGDPDTYNGTNWVPAGPGCNMSNDNCGVHTNSGVMNKWYQLLTDGGSGTNDVSNAYVVGGLGIEKAAKITYAAELAMTPNDDYAACRAATISSATTLYGSCSAEVEAVTRAWYAVNVGSAFIPCGPQITFLTDDTVISNDAGTLVCPGKRTIDIPIQVSSAPVGGSPRINITTSGTATIGVDFKLSTTSITFPVGSTAVQHLYVDILDHGAIAPDKTLIIDFTIVTNGSNVVKGNVYHQYKINITNKNKAPKAAGEVEYTAGQANVLTKIASPFFSAGRSARTQFIIKASDLKASGLTANKNISHISFNVIEKNSTRPFDGYTIKLGQTTQTQYTSAFITAGLTTVYTGNYTSVLGWNKIPLSSSFTWDGTSNIVCEICFANASNSTDNNDRTDGSTEIQNITAYNFSSSASTGCAFTFSNTKLSNTRPLVQFTQYDTANRVETVAPTNRSWDVHNGQEVYFYNNTNNNIIAKLNSTTQDLGCVTASVVKQGIGFTPLQLSTDIKRSVKEFAINPSINGSSTNYTATIYYDTSELGNTSLTNVRIVKTNALTDTQMNTGNTQILIPTITTMPGYKGYSGNFNGFSRYFIVDNPFTLPPPAGISSISNDNAIKVDNNPFKDRINISYAFNTSANADINLFDITGKLLYSNKKYLINTEHKFSIDLSHIALIPGNYVLQIITPNDALRKKMVKE